jgi:hypothetical protein
MAALCILQPSSPKVREFHILPNSFNNLDAPTEQERETMLLLLIFPSFRLALFAYEQGGRSGGGIEVSTSVKN